MATFGTLEGLESYLLDVLAECMNEVGRKVANLMKEHVQTDVYDKGTELGRSYYYDGEVQPTEQLMNSVEHSKVEKSGKSVSTTIANNPDFMLNEPNTYLHGSNYWRKKDVREMLPYLINEGKTGGLFGEVWEGLSRPYITNTFNELVDKDLVRTWLKQALEKRLGKGNVKI